jgi:hemolysin III
VSGGGGPVEASAVPAGALLTPGPAPRPRLRGWIHFWSFVVAMAACSALITVAATESSPLAVVATAVYSATVLGVFGVSALYHRVNWATPGGRGLVRRIDHSMIFLFIAGTYTPMTLLAMPPVPGIPVLVAVWVGALAGVTLKVCWPTAPRWLSVLIYVGLGWVAVLVLPDLLAGVGVAGFVLVLAGGLFYTLGAVCYALRWPDPWPSTFGYHEVFHGTTVLAACCHHIAVWFAVLG